MALMARVVVPGCLHHVTQRGNRRQTVFVEDADRAQYLQLLTLHCCQASVGIAGYCLMSNHVRLIAIPKAELALSKALGRTRGDYSRWWNIRHGEVGHVWQNRFYSCPLGGPHQWQALRYVELNPVRAGLVTEAWDWPWFSARAHLSGGDRTGLLDTNEWETHWEAMRWREVLEHGLEDGVWLERIREPLGPAGLQPDTAVAVELEARVKGLLRPQKRGPKAKGRLGDQQLSFRVS